MPFPLAALPVLGGILAKGGAAAGGAGLMAKLGALASSPAGQFALKSGGGYLLNRFLNRGQGNNQDPRMMAEEELMQQMRQPYQSSYEARANEARNRFNQQYMPQLEAHAQQFGGADQGGFGQLRQQGFNDLESKLAALGEESNQNAFMQERGRRGDLGNYLSGRRDLSQRQFEFGKKLPVELANTGLRYGELSNRFKELNNPLSYLENMAKEGYGAQSDTYRHGRQAGWPESIVNGLLQRR